MFQPEIKISLGRSLWFATLLYGLCLRNGKRFPFNKHFKISFLSKVAISAVLYVSALSKSSFSDNSITIFSTTLLGPYWICDTVPAPKDGHYISGFILL